MAREGEGEQREEQKEERGEDLDQETRPAAVAGDAERPPAEPTADHIKYTSVPTPRRKLGVVARPEIIGAAPVRRVLPDPKAQSLGRPHSAQERRTVDTEVPGRERLGSEGSKAKTGLGDIPSPSSPPPRPHSSQGKPTAAQRRARQAKVPLKIKPVSTQPSAAAMRLVQLKKDKEVAEVDGGGQGEGGRERKDEETPIQNGHPPGSGADRNAQSLEV